METSGSDVVRFEHYAFAELPLESKVPVVISSEFRLFGQGKPSGGRDPRAKRRTEEEVGRCAVRNNVHRSIDGLREAKGKEIEVQAKAGPFKFIEDAVSASDDGLVSEWPPGEPDSGSELLRVVGCNRD